MIARIAPLLMVLPVLAALHGTAQAQAVYPAPLSQTTQTTYVPQSVALSGPEEIDSEEGRRAPVGYTPVQRTRKGLLIGGGVTLGVSYMYSALFAAVAADASSYDSYDGSTHKNELGALWIPVVGPFLQMAQTDSATGRFGLAGLGAAQVTGAILLYYGLTTTKTVYVRNDLVGNLMITPMGSADSAGMAVAGRF